MPVYEYAGLDSSGKPLKGILDAESTVATRQKLRASRVFPVEVKAEEKGRASVNK